METKQNIFLRTFYEITPFCLLPLAFCLTQLVFLLWQQARPYVALQHHLTAPICTLLLDVSMVCVLFRYGWKWQEHLHQADEDYPWSRLLRRRQERLHPTCLPKHLHLHAVHDSRHWEPQDPLQIWTESGKTQVTAWDTLYIPPAIASTVHSKDWKLSSYRWCGHNTIT